ncbi:MAG: hypothetical protein KatS3mg110_1819 [Pirellulaceae bacterium]|nr:MAG: hypothetical protein KatS3mg110_1819 [Pirellulaceae bacterium]
MTGAAPPTADQKAHRPRSRLIISLGLLALSALLLTVGRAALEKSIAWQVTQKLQQAFPGVDVHLDQARIVSANCIELVGLRLMDRQSSGERAVLVSGRRVYVTVHHPKQWLSPENSSPADIVVVGGQAQLERFADGTWNVAPLVARGGGRQFVSQLHATDLRLILRCSGRPDRSPMVFHDVQLRLQPVKKPDGAHDSYRLMFQGSAAFCNRIRLQAEGERTQWHIQGELSQVLLSPELWDQLAACWPDADGRWRSLRGELDGSFTAKYDGHDWWWSASGKLRNGWFSDPEFPYAFTAIQADIQWEPHELRISNVAARSGVAELQLELVRTGSEDFVSGKLRVTARRLPLDDRLVRLLPEPLRRVWNEYHPSGRADVDLAWDFGQEQSVPRLAAELSDLAFVYRRFPYRVSRARGSLAWTDGQLAFHLHIPVGGRQARATGELAFPHGHPVGWVELSTEGAIPVDIELINALPESVANFVHRLNPTGTMEIAARWERSSEKEPFGKNIELFIQNGSIRYDRFPYPLEGVHGRVVVENQRVRFSRLVARHDSAFLTASGIWDPDVPDGWCFQMDCHATDVPLNESLRSALSPSVQRMWLMLQPQGTLDQIHVHLAYHPRNQKLAVTLSAQKWPPEQNIEGRAVSLRPVWFPYRWDNVTGRFSYEQGRISFHDIRAEHGPARIRSLSGSWQTAPEGHWQLSINRMELERLNLDEELLDALPGSLREKLVLLGLQGAINGGVEFYLEGMSGQLTAAQWNGHLDTEDGRLVCGSPWEHIRGGVAIQGRWREHEWHLDGSLHVDSVEFRNIHLTRLRGPFQWSGRQLRLGNSSDSPSGQSFTSPVTARLFGGDLALTGVVQLDPQPKFWFDARLSDADLAQAAVHLGPTPPSVSGKLFGQLLLGGTAGVVETWSGQGSAEFTQANLYQLPLMIALLKLLNVRPPDPTAFTSGDIQFRWEGERLYFSRIALQGDAISLVGRGQADLSRQLNLTFYALVGREDAQLPILRPLFQEAARNVLLIDVTGSLAQPIVTPRPFPELNETLQQWLTESLNETGPWSEAPPRAASRAGTLP